ncbi:MAG TPA: hypothetical protein DEP35_10985 [Deltaproteobacteria bacterium]|nr:hypothetical protein [Deltaproteobacteria bacterium]
MSGHALERLATRAAPLAEFLPEIGRKEVVCVGRDALAVYDRRLLRPRLASRGWGLRETEG